MKKYIGSMRQQHIHSKTREKNIVAIVHIYEAIAIIPLFCYHQDTESE